MEHNNKAKKQTEENVREWLNAHRRHLPINVDTWRITVKPKAENNIENNLLSFGKNRGTADRTDSFYKNFSRIVTLKTNEP